MAEMVNLRGKISRTTERAILFRANDAEEACWLPLALVEVSPVEGRSGEVLVDIPEWLAMEKELI